MEVPAKRVADINDRLGRFILNCFVVLDSSDADLSEKIESSAGKPGNQVYDVKFTINGHEIPVEEAVEYWMKRCEEGVNYAAAQLVKDKLNSVGGKVMDAQEEIDRILGDLKGDVIKELGFSYDSYEGTIN